MDAMLLQWSVGGLEFSGHRNNVDMVDSHAVDRGAGGMSGDKDHVELQVGGYSECQ
jgi:hypothetical protein